MRLHTTAWKKSRPAAEGWRAPLLPEELTLGLKPREQEKLRALSREPNAELYFHGLLHLASEFEARGAAPKALLLYQIVSHASEEKLSPEILATANERALALQGHGSFGLRFESQLSHQRRQLSSPLTLATFALSGSVYRFSRLALSARLTAPAGASAVRMLGGKIFSEIAAIGAETIAFNQSRLALQRCLGDAASATPSHWFEDGAATFLTLASLRFAHRLVGAVAADRIGGIRSQGIAREAATFAGLHLSAQLQEKILPDPTRSPVDFWNSLQTFFQFKIGNELGARLLGRKFSAWENEMRLRESAARSQVRNWPDWAGSRFAAALPAGTSGKLQPSPKPSNLPQPLFSITLKPFSGGSFPTKGLPRLLPVIQSVSNHARRMAPKDAVGFLSSLSRLLHQHWLKKNAIHALAMAHDRVPEIEYLIQKIAGLQELAKAEAAIEHRDDAVVSLGGARLLIEEMDISSQVHSLGQLALIQLEIKDPGSVSTFLLAERALDRLASEAQLPSRETLAGHHANGGKFSHARRLMDQQSSGTKSYALADIAKNWAKLYRDHPDGQYLSLASATFVEAYRDVGAARELMGLDHAVNRFQALLHVILSVGENFHHMTEQWLPEYEEWVFHKAINPNSKGSLVADLSTVWTRYGFWEKGLRLSQNPILGPEQRSKAILNTILHLVKKAQFHTAQSILNQERFYPTQRFSALLALAKAQNQSGPEQVTDAAKNLTQAYRLIMGTEFYPPEFSRPEGLLQLAEEIRGLVGAWLDFGASLTPSPKQVRSQIAENLSNRLVANFHSAGPHLEKSHQLLLLAAHRLDSQILEGALRNKIRERVAGAFEKSGGKSIFQIETLDFQASDRVLYHSLSWLARFGGLASRTLLNHLLATPGFPKGWQASLQRALGKNPSKSAATSSVLN